MNAVLSAILSIAKELLRFVPEFGVIVVFVAAIPHDAMLWYRLQLTKPDVSVTLNTKVMLPVAETELFAGLVRLTTGAVESSVIFLVAVLFLLLTKSATVTL